jgi:hypothetical protein
MSERKFANVYKDSASFTDVGGPGRSLSITCAEIKEQIQYHIRGNYHRRN